jgi:hypothetical protein
VSLADSVSDPAMRHRTAVQRAVNLFFGLGRGRQALDVLAADPAGAPFNRAWLLVNMAHIDDARRAFTLDHDDRRSVLVTSAWIDALGGRPDAAIEVLDRLAVEGQRLSTAPSRFRDFPTIPYTLGLLEAGRIDEALESAEDGHAASVEHHPDFIRAWWLFLLARTHADAGRLATAAALFRQGEVLQARLNQPGLMRWFIGGAAYALVQTSDGRETDRLLAACDEIPDRDEQVFGVLVDGARCWRRWRRGDHRGAVTELIAVGDRAAQTGSLSASRRLWFDAARLGGAQHVGDRLDLGDTDLDLARRCFVDGIASCDLDAVDEQLFVSLRTVNNLIQRAYGKLGVSSRAEAAQALGIDRQP